MARSIPPASATALPGSTRIAAPPATSGSAPAAVATTGVPEAIASSKRQPEALVAAGEDEAGRTAVEAGELVLRDVAEQLDRDAEPGRCLLGLDAPALVGADEHEPGRALADQRQRLDRGRRLLARLERADEERVRLAVGRRAFGPEGRVGGERRDGDLLLGGIS